MRRISFILCFLSLSLFALAQDHNHNHDDGHGHSHDTHADAGHANECGYVAESHEFDPANTAFHHIADQNVFSIGPLAIAFTLYFICS